MKFDNPLTGIITRYSPRRFTPRGYRNDIPASKAGISDFIPPLTGVIYIILTEQTPSASVMSILSLLSRNSWNNVLATLKCQDYQDGIMLGVHAVILGTFQSSDIIICLIIVCSNLS